MGRKNEIGNSTSLVDQYRKQLGLDSVFWIKYILNYFLGRQEKKVVNERRREIKRLKAEQEDVSYWKVWLQKKYFSELKLNIILYF